MEVTIFFPTEDRKETFENVEEADTEYGDENIISLYDKEYRELTTELGVGISIDSVELEPDEKRPESQ